MSTSHPNEVDGLPAAADAVIADALGCGFALASLSADRAVSRSIRGLVADFDSAIRDLRQVVWTGEGDRAEALDAVACLNEAASIVLEHAQRAASDEPVAPQVSGPSTLASRSPVDLP